VYSLYESNMNIYVVDSTIFNNELVIFYNNDKIQLNFNYFINLVIFN